MSLAWDHSRRGPRLGPGTIEVSDSGLLPQRSGLAPGPVDVSGKYLKKTRTLSVLLSLNMVICGIVQHSEVFLKPESFRILHVSNR